MSVGYEGHVAPDPGPLELYRSVFPGRYVIWNAARQCFEIRERSGSEDRRVEFVADMVEEPPDPDALDARARKVRVFRPFDYEFVRQRMRERYEYEVEGADRYTDKILERNRKLTNGRLRTVANDNAARIGEVRRYLPTLDGDSKIPMVAGCDFPKPSSPRSS